MFMNTQMAGMNMAFPDVCLTPAPPAPPLPIPYPNIAMPMMAIPNQMNLLVMAMPAHNLGTTIPMTNGDNAGLMTGVASGTVMGPSRHVTGAFTVLLCGMPVTRMTSMSIQNSTNAPGCQLVPSQPVVLVLAG